MVINVWETIKQGRRIESPGVGGSTAQKAKIFGKVYLKEERA